MAGAKVFARGVVIAAMVVAFGGGCSAISWGVANAAYAVGHYVGAH